MSPRKQIGRVAGLGFGALGLAGVSALTALRRTLPRTSGLVRVPGLLEQVRVQRDRWGVPHIYAGSSHDLFFAQGYVHAQDRLWQMELNRRSGHGRLAEIFGPVALSSDRFTRIMGFGRVAAREAAMLDAETRAEFGAYVEGINAFVAQAGSSLPPEFLLLRLRPEPWEIADVLVWGKLMALSLSENWAGEVLRARLVAEVGAERANALEPSDLGQPLTIPAGALYHADLALDAVQLAGEAAPFSGQSNIGQGSNAWAVSGNRSTSGQPLLANDPHLGLTMPGLWYETHLEGGGYSVAGASLPGVPGVVIGHNARIAWGCTNVMADVQDLYIERFHTEDPLRYQWQGGWEQAELVRELIQVKGQAEPVVEEIRITRHGPVISPLVPNPSNQIAVVSSQIAQALVLTSEASAAQQAVGPATTAVPTTNVPTTDVLSLCWTALEPGSIARAVLRLNRAGNWREFRAALADWTVPPLNFTYADVDGHVGYALGGRIPLRAPDHDGRLPVPGWEGKYEWRGYIAGYELPATLDPPQGYVVNANNRIMGDDYAHPLRAEWLAGYRAMRATALLEQQPQHDSASFARMQRDLFSLPGRELAALAKRLPADTLVAAAARETLRRWDGALSAESAGGVIYATLRYHLQQRAYPEVAALRHTPTGLGAFASLPANLYLDRALPDLLRRIRERDNNWLGAGQSWDAVLAEAWRLTIDELRAALGDDVAEWRYGRLHTLTLRHPLGALPALTRFFNRGPWPTGGDFDTLWMGFVPRDTAAGPVYTGPSYRQIYDLSNWDHSVSGIPAGQSGNPLSRHYADQSALWLRGECHPMPWSRQAVQQATVATLILLNAKR